MTDTPTDTTAAAPSGTGEPGPNVQKAHRDYLAKRTLLQWAHGRHGELTEQAERNEDHRDADRFHDENLAPAIRDAGEAADALIDALYELMPAIQTALDEARAYRLGDAADEDDDELSDEDRARLRDIRALADQLGMKV